VAAASFVVSLAYFLFTYAITFAEPVAGRLRWTDLAWDTALFTAFALHHSVFARTPVRALVAGTVPPGLERSLYVAVASVLFILVCRWWRPLPGSAWQVGGLAAWVFHAGQAFGVWLTLRSAAILDVRELAGLPTGRSGDRHDGAFSVSGPYGWVRHPIYAGWFLVVFSVAAMTNTRLAFACISSLYILIAIPFEERTLRRTAGQTYDRYAAKVKWRLVPGVY
jgi:protein-S-isoprenylcysteine O-methyltransferase Ste14